MSIIAIITKGLLKCVKLSTTQNRRDSKISKEKFEEYLKLRFYPGSKVLSWSIGLVIRIGVKSRFSHTWLSWDPPLSWFLARVPLVHSQVVSLRRLVISLLLQGHWLESFKAPNRWHCFSLKQANKMKQPFHWRTKHAICILPVEKKRLKLKICS